jgi:hypothetical protein
MDFTMSAAKLWWKFVSRRQAGAAALLVGAGAFAIMLAVDSRAALAADGPNGASNRVGAVNVLLLLALVIVAFVPVVLRGRGVTSSRRFDLLPLSPLRRGALRLAMDNPGAILAGLGGIAVGIPMALSLSGGDPWFAALHVVEIATAFALAVLISDILATHVGSRHPNVVFWPSLVVGMAAVQTFVEYPILVRTPGALLVGRGDAITRWLSVRPDAPIVLESGVALALLASLAVMLWVEVSVRPTPLASANLEMRRSGGVLERILPARDPLHAKERAYVLRPVISRNAAVVSSVIVLGAFVVRQPSLHLIAFGFWILFTQNAFAFDLPLSGTTRYRLIPISTSRIVHAREQMMWRAVAIPVAVLAVPALIFVPFGRWLILWPVLAFGSGLFFLCALAGRVTSSRASRAVNRSTILVQGSIIGIMGYFAIAAVTIMEILASILVYAPTREWIGPGAPAAGVAAGIVGCASVAAYVVATRWEARHQSLLFASTVPADG